MSALKKNIIDHNISSFLEDNLLLFFFNYNHMSTEEWRVLKNQFSKIKKVNTLVVKNKIGKKILTSHISKGLTPSITPTLLNSRCDVKGVEVNSDLQILSEKDEITHHQRWEPFQRWCDPCYGTSAGKKTAKQCSQVTPTTTCRESNGQKGVLESDSRSSPKTGKSNPFENLYTLFQGPTFLIGVNDFEPSKQVFYTVKKEKKLLFVGGLYQKKQINHLDLDYLLKLDKGLHRYVINILQSLLYCTFITTSSVNLYYLLQSYTEKAAD